MTHDLVNKSPDGVYTVPGRRGRAALFAGLIMASGFFLIAVFADFMAPYDYCAQARLDPMAPVSTIRFRDSRGRWSARPFLYSQHLIDPLQRAYQEDPRRAYPIGFFVRGYKYNLFGFLPTDRHLFGLRDRDEQNRPRVYLLGTDGLGRDRFSRLLIAARFSLSVVPLSALIACAIGLAVGSLAGYVGGWIDAVLMRITDAMMSLPILILILAVRAAFKPELPPLSAAMLLMMIFALSGWGEMARLTRGLVMGLRQRDFVLAAESIGASTARILWRHILPNAARPLTAQALLTLPAFLLAETAFSFLGAGLQEPEPSWGNMLIDAFDLTLLESGHAALLLMPALAITLFALSIRLVINGLEKS